MRSRDGEAEHACDRPEARCMLRTKPRGAESDERRPARPPQNAAFSLYLPVSQNRSRATRRVSSRPFFPTEMPRRSAKAPARLDPSHTPTRSSPRLQASPKSRSPAAGSPNGGGSGKKAPPPPKAARPHKKGSCVALEPRVPVVAVRLQTDDERMLHLFGEL